MIQNCFITDLLSPHFAIGLVKNHAKIHPSYCIARNYSYRSPLKIQWQATLRISGGMVHDVRWGEM